MASDLDAELWTQSKPAAEKYGLNWIQSLGRKNLSPRTSGCIHTGQNSGFQAINLCYMWSATHVLLLGYDMSTVHGTHWFGDHKHGLQRESPFSEFVQEYETIDRPDLEIINCSRETAINCFPRMTINEALNAVRNRTTTDTNGQAH